MFYAKHPVFGNKHFESVDRAAMEAGGWKFFPHPEGNLPAYLPVQFFADTQGEQLKQIAETPDGEAAIVAVFEAAVVKRKGGRPKRVA